MENGDDKGLLLSNIVKARYRLKDELLLYNEFDNLVPDFCKLTNVTYCDIKNISESSLIRNNKIHITISFDLIIIYEYFTSENIKTYHLYIESIKKFKDIEIGQYKPSVTEKEFSNLKCRNLIKDISYKTDIDISYKKIILTIYAAIDSILLKEETLKLSVSLSSIERTGETKMENMSSQKNIINIDDENSLNTYINYLSSLLKKAKETYKTNKELEESLLLKEKKISFLEYKHNELNKECSRLNSEIKDKDRLIDELRQKLEKTQKKADILAASHLALSKELEAFEKENNNLKVYMDNEENKKKKQLTYKIKSAISNMKMFT